MTDAAAGAPLTWAEVQEAFSTMDHQELATRMPASPSTQDLLSRYPELAAVTFRELLIDGPHGHVPARLYTGEPTEETAAALVWVHGGAFIGGDLDMAEAHWVGLMLARHGIPVLSVDYRKCLHGVHFPVPSDDVLAAWCWAVDNAQQIGVTPSRLHLGGASAGGNLVAGVVKRLRDGAGPAPASLVLAYPDVHPELPPIGQQLAAALGMLEQNVLTPDTVRALNLNYAGTEQSLSDPYAFAANGNVAGQPPVYILNSDVDALRASGEAYATQLILAGVTVLVELEPGAVHGQLNEPFGPTGPRSIQRVAAWLGLIAAAPAA